MTPLMWAAFHGQTEHVRVLVEKGADPSIGDMDGMTAVHWSIQRHDTRVLQVGVTRIIFGSDLLVWFGGFFFVDAY